ncbi:hypothetical protein V2J09_015072, partial [Rumex salicifolius]
KKLLDFADEDDCGELNNFLGDFGRPEAVDSAKQAQPFSLHVVFSVICSALTRLWLHTSQKWLLSYAYP